MEVNKTMMSNIDSRNDANIKFEEDETRVTCIERKYKVENSKVSIVIVARKELGEDTTGKLLHEDMELKTFLANYDIILVSQKKIPEDVQNVDHDDTGLFAKRNLMPEDVQNVDNKDIGSKRNLISEKNKLGKIRQEAFNRRSLFDSLGLKKKFTPQDYANAIIKKGIKITNRSMPRDDMICLEKQGKVKKLEKKSNIWTYIIIEQ